MGYFGSFNDELDAAKRVNQVCKEYGLPLKNPGIGTMPNQHHTRHATEKKSKYKGVHWNTSRRKWQAQMLLKNGSTKYGGIFNDELDAAKRVNQLCQEFGNIAKN